MKDRIKTLGGLSRTALFLIHLPSYWKQKTEAL
jgi:hypothetical protein